MKIAAGSRVELDYELIDSEGDLLESSQEGGGTLAYVHGRGEIPEALEVALLGAMEGDRLEVSLGPGEAFGEHDPAQVVTVPLDELPPGTDLEAGDWIPVTLEDEDGEQAEIDVRVVEVQAESLLLDANHPLAGQSVTFRLRVVSVQ